MSQSGKGAFIEVDEDDPFVALQLRVLLEDDNGFVATEMELSEPGRYELKRVDTDE